MLALHNGLLAQGSSDGGNKQKLLIIFGRGGNDMLNTFAPLQDQEYVNYRGAGSASNIALSDDNGITIPGLGGDRFFVAHPKLSKLVDRMQEDRVAILGSVGNAMGSRSHFTEMRIMETGELSSRKREGWGGKLAQQLQPTIAGSIPAASHSPLGQLILRSSLATTQVPVLRDIYDTSGQLMMDVTFTGMSTPQSIILSGQQTPPTGWRSNVNEVVASDSDMLRTLRLSGKSFFDAKDQLALAPDLVHNGTHFPRTTAELNSQGLDPANVAGKALLRSTQEAMHVLRHTDARIAGIDFGSFDTHEDQLKRQEDLFEYLSHAIWGADRTGQAHSGTDYLILFLTEFGRTSLSNGSGGTDHGIASTWLAIGDNVRGGTYNMVHGGLPDGAKAFGATWDPLPPLSAAETARPVKTDFRMIFAEILKKKFGMNDSQVDIVLQHNASNLYTRTAPPPEPFLDFLT